MEDELFHTQAPPSYALESGSEGDSDVEVDSKTKDDQGSKEADPVIKVIGNVQKGTHVVLLVGEACEILSKGLKVSDESAQISVDGEQVASIHSITSSKTIVLVSDTLVLASMYSFASTLFSSLTPASTVILSCYHFPTYVPQSSHGPARLLYLASTPQPSEIDALSRSGDLVPFAPPNLLHGLVALFLTLSTVSNKDSSLIVLPSNNPPSPLNGPFLTSPFSATENFYGHITRSLSRVAEVMQWHEWWDQRKKDGTAFEWVEKQRKLRRREQQGHMYM